MGWSVSRPNLRQNMVILRQPGILPVYRLECGGSAAAFVLPGRALQKAWHN